MRHLTQAATAWLLGVPARSLRDHAEIPREDDRTYDASKVVAWRAGKTLGPEEKLIEGASQTLKDDYVRQQVLEKAEKAKLARLERMERERALIPREEIHLGLKSLAEIVKNLGASLQKHYGPGALQLLEETIEEYEHRLGELFGTNGNGGVAGGPGTSVAGEGGADAADPPDG